MKPLEFVKSLKKHPLTDSELVDVLIEYDKQKELVQNVSLQALFEREIEQEKQDVHKADRYSPTFKRGGREKKRRYN